jgi:signal transduction histidine kinase
MVEVSDSGHGIDPHSLEHIFEPFYSTKAEGLGMGLAISRSIVESHGGELTAIADNGDGATFRFSVPLYQQKLR